MSTFLGEAQPPNACGMALPVIFAKRYLLKVNLSQFVCWHDISLLY